MRIPLAKMAVEETGMGVVEDKVIKNNYAAEYIYNAYKNTKTCDVIEECKRALMRASKNLLPNNFIEGMACVGGCIGGAGCLTHGEKNKAEVDKYGKLAHEKTITEAIQSFSHVEPKKEN